MTTTLILDGFLGRPRRWERLRALTEARVGPAKIVRYASTGRLSLEEIGQGLIDEIRQHPAPVNLVGFSMGGLVIRSAHLIDPALPVRRAVFINSPHRGTWMACLVPTPGVRNMRPFDEHIRRLNEVAWTAPTLTVWNRIDGIVLPARSTRFGAGRHLQAKIPLHIWPVWSRSIQRRVVDFLAEDAVPLREVINEA
ncbi:MAG: alpha/beta fold hydrolase [Tepidisphaeraceae bacterium]